MKTFTDDVGRACIQVNIERQFYDKE